MSYLIDLSIRNARLTILFLLFFLISGSLAYQSIPKEAEPDIKIPIINVSLSFQGISPEDSERLLLRPMESALKNIKDIKVIRSTAYQGGGNVELEFQAGADLETALEDVRSKVTDARQGLPQGAAEPSVSEVNLSDVPILVATLSGDASERQLLASARELKKRIEDVDGVLEAKLQGARRELVEVIIDPVKLPSYGLKLDQMIGAVADSNSLVAAGSLEGTQGRYAVKVPALIETIEEIGNLPIIANNNAVVRFRDLATIRSTYEGAESITRLNGKPSIAVEISKRTGANLINTVDGVRKVAEDFEPMLPEGAKITFSQDNSDQIRQLLHDLQNSVLTAVILVFIVILYALSGRASLFIGFAIPVSFLMGILFLSLAGYTVNLVVLFGLILAVGMLVDDAIIVTEYAERRMAEGMGKVDAYAMAAKKMTGPVTAATLTRIAAFSPLLFWPGTVGEFMKYMPITLIATLSASLVYALVFTPTLGAIFAKPPRHEEVPKDGLYMETVHLALRHPKSVLALAVAILLAVPYTYGKIGNGIEFFPDVEPDGGLLRVLAHGNMSLEEKDKLVRLAEGRIIGWPGIKSVYTRVDSSSGGGHGASDVIGTIQYEFVNWRERKPANDIMLDLRDQMAGMPGIEVEVSIPNAGPTSGKEIQIRLSGADPAKIEDTAHKVVSILRADPDILDISDGLSIPGLDWELKINRSEAAKYGIGPGAVGTVVQLVTSGLKLSDYRPAGADDAVEIRLRLPEDRRTLATLDQLRIETALGSVPISNFVTREPAPSVGTLNRINGERTVDVQANVKEGVQVSVVQDRVAEMLSEQDFGDTRWKMAGSDQDSAEASDFLLKAFGAAIFLIFVVLLAQFNNFTSVWLVLSAVVMSTIGVFLGLMITGQPFGIVMSGIGVIALAGVVVNNNIVLIETYDTLRHEGMNKLDAILQTCRERARPVVLTAMTAILGVLPIAFGVNIELMSRETTIGAPSTQWWISLSSAIVFGLAFSTVLTLIITPSALMVFTRENPQDSIINKVKNMFRRRRRPEREPETETVAAE